MTIRVKTAEEFRSFLSIAQRGERAIYHRGFLACDKLQQPTLCELANAANQANVCGLATLTQRRIADELYEYVAVRC